MITWWFLAVICSVLTAAYIYINQVFKLPSYILMVYRGVFLFVLLLPIAFFIDINFSYKFYIFASIQGLIIGYGDYRYFEASRKYGAEITGSLKPFSLIITFFLWFIVSPSNYQHILSDPVHFLIILTCILGTIVAVYSINSVSANKAAVRYIIPCILISTVIDTMNKTTMDLTGGVSTIYAAYYYVLITALFSGFYNVFLYVRNKHTLKELFERRNLVAGAVVLFSVSLLTGIKAYAMSLTPNPAYVSAIIYLSPIWIILANTIYFKINKNIEYIKVNKKSVGLLLTSVIILVLMTR